MNQRLHFKQSTAWKLSIHIANTSLADFVLCQLLSVMFRGVRRFYTQTLLMNSVNNNHYKLAEKNRKRQADFNMSMMKLFI